ncbi:MAG TPA: phosphatase PAP2 family protein [Candidatus Paceibacterota bacterium]
MKIIASGPALERLNDEAFRFAASIRSEGLSEFMTFVTDIGSPQNMAMLSLVLVCLYWLHRKYVHMIQFALAMGSVSLITWGLKNLFRAPRPEDSIMVIDGFSFPSGHASTATLLFVLVAYTYKGHIKNIWLRRVFIGANVLAVILIGFSRVYFGVHYATDVIAGIVIAAIMASISIIITETKFKEAI